MSSAEGDSIRQRRERLAVDTTTLAERAGRVKQRRTALGITVKRLAELAGVDRGTLAAIENGASARDSSVGAIEAALRSLEEESGVDDAPPLRRSGSGNGCIEFEVLSDCGARVIVRGRAAEAEILERSVARLVRELAAGSMEPTA